MKRRQTTFGMIGVTCMLALLSFGAQAQDDSLLDQAFGFLQQGQYQSAEDAANAYLSANPRRYRADFIVAVAECSLHQGMASAMQRIAAIKQDYALEGQAQIDVDRWISECAPEPPAVATPGVTASAIKMKPGFGSAAPNQLTLKALPAMGGLVYGTSYSGDDYVEYSAIASADDCAHVCRLQAPCRSMTYAKSSKKCWLKRSVPPAQPGSDFVSAIKILNGP